MISKTSKNESRNKRHLRIRKTVQGTNERPRLSVYRSNTAIYAQLIDDVNQVTLFSARSQEAELKHSNIASAQINCRKSACWWCDTSCI